MKKVISLALLCVMVFSFNVVGFAKEPVISTGNADSITIDRAENEIYEIVDRQTTTYKGARLSWGEGILHADNPLTGKPRAYAETKTFSGTANSMYAQVGLVDGDGISYTSSKQTAEKVSSVTSATLLSPTEKCDFIGYHGIQDTETSGWQVATTSRSF